MNIKKLKEEREKIQVGSLVTIRDAESMENEYGRDRIGILTPNALFVEDMECTCGIVCRVEKFNSFCSCDTNLDHDGQRVELIPVDDGLSPVIRFAISERHYTVGMLEPYEEFCDADFDAVLSIE